MLFVDFEASTTGWSVFCHMPCVRLYAVGYFLEQGDHFGDKRPVAFGERKLHKECLAVVKALKAYRPYVLGNRFDLYTDH